ncbi:MAG: helix-turn-helix domain-containing protein [Maribacter sp.]
MNVLEQLIEQIPIRHNLTSSIMLIGIVQTLFISLVIFIRSNKNYAIKYLGWSFFFSAIVFFDTYLCYTGLIKNMMFLNDSTEFLVLLIFPFTYFSIYGLIKRSAITIKKHWWHFILPVGYFLTQIPFYLAPLSVKYNAYLGAYFPEFEPAEVTEAFNYSYHTAKDVFDWFILFSIFFYTLISLKLVRDERNKNVKGKSSKYIFTRNSVIVLLLLLIFIFSVFYSYDDDSGDHYIVFFQALIAFSTTYLIMSESRFFEKSWIADKYETLGNSKSDVSFEEIQNYVDQENYFLAQKASLQNLAALLNAHPNQVSKSINLGNESNFNDYINQKRVTAAKTRLLNAEYAHLTIEAIGTSVGFKSKSAFYSAFKKHTSTSPSAFTKEVSP